MEENIKKIEDISTQESPQKALRNAARIRRMEILEKVIKKVGFRNARKRTKSLSKTYNVVERTIYTDFGWIKKNIKPDDIKEIKITVRVAIDNALDEAMEKFVTEPTIENSKNIIQIAKGYREELEAWGEKEPITPKYQLEHSGQTGIIFNEITKSAEEIKDGRERDNTIPETKGNS